jgi:hypothetical protein
MIMNDDELRGLQYAVGQCQAINLANLFILTEVVTDLARAEPNPERYLAGMFEKISVRADNEPIEKESHPVNVELRETISGFFAMVTKRLRGRE